MYDKNMHYIELEDGNYICYSDELRKMIKVSKETKNHIVNYFNNSIKSIDEEKEIAKILIDAGLLFHTDEEYEKNTWNKKYLKMKEKISLKIAYIHMTQRCNLNCEYCYNKKNRNKHEELTTLQWKQIILKLKEKGINSFIFTGGETFLRKDLFEIVRETKDSNTNVQILTNGTLLDSQPVELLEYIDSMIISMDSTDIELNNQCRENSLIYNVQEKIKSIPSRYKDKIYIRSVITDKNANEIEKMRDKVEKEMGFHYISTIFIPNSIDEVEKVPKLKLKEVDDEKKVPFSSNVVNCGGCSQEIAVDSNGDLYPCQNLILPEMRIGNILEGAWYDTLEKSKVTQMMQKTAVTNIEKCKECKLKYECGGGCRAIAYKVYGNINAHLEYFCNHLKQDALVRIKNTKFKKRG